MNRRKHYQGNSPLGQNAERGSKIGSGFIVIALATGAWMALPQDDDDAAALETSETSPVQGDTHEAFVTTEQSVAFVPSFGDARKADSLDSTSPVSESETNQTDAAAQSHDADAEAVADNDSAPDPQEDAIDLTLSADTAMPSRHAQTPPEIAFARAVTRLNIATSSQQLELVDQVWALGLDLRHEQAALAAIEPLTSSQDLLLAARARDASESLSAVLAASAAPEDWTSELAAETSAYVMDLNIRATSDPDPLARRAAITELASHPHPDTVAALATAALDADIQNRTQVISSLMQLASSGYQEQRIVAMLEAIATRETPEVASYAWDAVQALRQAGRTNRARS